MTYTWREKTKQPTHVDDWLITYADMITLLLCFFVVFTIVSATKKIAPHEPSQPAKIETTALPKAIPQDLQQAPLPMDIIPNDGLFHKIGPEDFPAAPVLDPAPPEPVKAAAVAETPPATPALLPQPVPLPQIVEDLKADIATELGQKGDRLTTMEINSATFFDSGSAVLNEPGKIILEKVAGNLKSGQYKDYQITVEGHTDDTPIDTPQFPSNWELSAARAAAVVRIFRDQGIPAQKLRAAGYADAFPKVPNRDAAGNPIPENQAKNRRVVIKLEKIDKT